ncbi:MAG: DAK2 domain-containing protein [Actinobacteria bacterium]|nr:DAK2 domain-containing protein [Actinomycetota bacterium]
MLAALDPSAIRRWSTATLAALETYRQEIDDLNVFPVPDGDTGTNLALTVRAATAALGAAWPPDTAGCLAVLARGAVLGARGSSGVILSQILRGVAAACPAESEVDGARIAAGLSRGAELAYAAVAAPVEGTILSVARAAADAAGGLAAGGAGLAAVVEGAATEAARALARTPSQLEVLARAGVVDAGGRGLLVVLDALAAVVTGRVLAAREPQRAARPQQLLETARETGSSEFGYEVQYLLQAEDAAVTRLRVDLAGLGDSLVVVGAGDGQWNVHVHVNDVGAALEAGVEAGRPFRITVTRFADQRDRPPAVATTPPAGGVAIVAVAPGEGLAELFESEGARVVRGGAGQPGPSTAELLAVIGGSGADRVVIVPNSGDLLAVAGAAAAEARAGGRQVSVVPSRSPVQGLAAVAVHDPGRRFDDDVIAMTEAAAATRHAAVTVAVREALTMAGRCAAGDVLGLVESEVVLVGESVTGVSRELVDRLLVTGGELVTVIIGADAPEGLAAVLGRHVLATHPEVEVVVYPGGQPIYPVLLGVE